jgi:Rrf2 family iron-sulfur cluster assembly transcriptional regulator
VRLEITRRSDLATRALLELARRGERTKSSVLADSVGTTPGFLSQVMTPLVAMGWVGSEPGPAGGYTVRIELSDLSVLQIIEAIEGPTETGRCVLEDRACVGGEPCALHRPWSSARSQLLGELSATPLSALTSGSTS